MSALIALLGTAGALIGKWALEDLLPKLLPKVGDGLVALFTSFVDAQGNKVSAKEGAKIMADLQPTVDRVVRNIQGRLPDASGQEKKDKAFLILTKDFANFEGRITNRHINSMIENAVAKLPPRGEPDGSD